MLFSESLWAAILGWHSQSCAGEDGGMSDEDEQALLSPSVRLPLFYLVLNKRLTISYTDSPD